MGNIVTLTGATGSVTIQATQAGNGTYSAAAPVNQTFAVSALTPQTITFPSISNGAANDPPFVLIGTSDSGLALSYAVTSGLATISGNTVTVVGLGTCSITASQAGNPNYAPASSVIRSFTVFPLGPIVVPNANANAAGGDIIPITKPAGQSQDMIIA